MLDDLADNESVINASRWIYVSFLKRLEREVTQNWAPSSAVHSTETRYSEAPSNLSPNGQVTGIVVTVPSGITEFDNEELRAVRVTAPFHAVPECLIERDGQITVAFSFYFEPSTRSRAVSVRPSAAR
jgi:TonB family protein